MKLKWTVRLSIWLNEITGGTKGYTLCAELYWNFLKSKDADRSRRLRLVMKFIDSFFTKPNHCRGAMLAAWKRTGAR